MPEGGDTAKSRVSERLFDRVCEGKLPVSEAQAIAGDIVADYGAGRQARVDGWASLGKQGQHKGNCHRDLRRWAGSFGLDLEIGKVSTPVKNLFDQGTVNVDHCVLYPHEVFAAAWEQGLPVFKHMFCPNGEAELREFWHEQRDHEWVQRHPAFSQLNADKGFSVPMGIHADKGQHIKKYKILVMAWGSVMCRAPTVWSKILYTVVPDEILIPRETDERLYAALVWSFQWLMHGLWPPTDHDGNAWPRGSRRAFNSGKPLAG